MLRNHMNLRKDVQNRRCSLKADKGFPYRWDYRMNSPISITWISVKPERARFFSISHPKPPAPLNLISLGLKSTARFIYITLGDGVSVLHIYKEGNTDRTLERARVSFTESPGWNESKSVNGPARSSTLSRYFLELVNFFRATGGTK
jgi:hypothetical protein